MFWSSKLIHLVDPDTALSTASPRESLIVCVCVGGGGLPRGVHFVSIVELVVGEGGLVYEAH